jgi:sialate O-acetylesterase
VAHAVHPAEAADAARAAPGIRVTEAVRGLSSAREKDIILQAPFGDGMVLPRRAVTPLAGRTAAGARVAVIAGWAPDQVARGRADGDGRFSIDLPAGEAGGPYSIQITSEAESGGGRLAIDDVLLGEVWLAGGQSNMQMTVGPGGGLDGVLDWPDEIARAGAPEVRMLTVPDASAWSASTSFSGSPVWTPVSPETVGGMSAVAWFFAERLHAELGVPVGIIDASVGGTRIEAWMSEDAAADVTGLEDWLFLVRSERREPGFMRRWRADREAAAAREAESRDPGFAGGWMAADIDDATWSTVAAGSHWSAEPLASHDGYVWMRRRVTIDPALAGDGTRPWTLHLGGIDDRDETWVNGTRVGRTDGDGRWNEPRRYAVPAGLVKAGENLIAIRVRDTGGPGGMVGPAEAMRLVPGAGTDPTGGVALDGDWRYRITLREPEIAEPAPVAPPRADRNLPSVLFNAMLAPLAGFPVDGAIFYQGESNVGDPLYAELLPTLIEDWRRHFHGAGRGGEGAAAAMPFLAVQIAPYGYSDGDGAAWIREVQRRTADRVRGYDFVVTTDVGARHDIHPIDKRPVGERLAELALAQAYGLRRAEARSPRPVAIEPVDGGMRVRFAYAGDGLVVAGGRRATHWQLQGPDGRWVVARADVDGDAVSVRSPRVPEPRAVRFGWGASPTPNLFGPTGLPVTPFTSEPFPIVR